MKFLKLFSVVCFTLMLSGCFGNEVNDVAHVVALGFDKSDTEDNYKITIQFANPTQISGGSLEEGGKSGPDIVENVVVEAPNMYAAINIANHIVSKKFSLFHTKIFVVSEEIAREGVGDLLDTLSRSDEIRPDVYIAVSLCEASEYLTEVKPIVELNPAKYYQLAFNKNDSQGFPRCTMQDFYVLENLDYSDIAIPLAGIMKTEDKQSENQSSESNKIEKNLQNSEAPLNKGDFEYKIKNYVAGQVATAEKNKSEAMGMAVFSGKQMTGVRGSTDSVLYNILNGRYKDSYITFHNNTDTPLTVKITQRRRPQIKVNVKNKTVNIELFLESDLYSLSANYSLEQEISDFENRVTQIISESCSDFIKGVRDEQNADVLGIGMKAKKAFLTNDDFENYNWREKFKEYEISVNTDFKIRRSGLTLSERRGGDK